MAEEPSKPFYEKILTPIVIAAIGIGGTVSVTQAQIKSSEYIAKGQLDVQKEKNQSDHLLALIKMFIEEKNINARKFILGYIEKLDPKVAGNLASLVNNTPSENQDLRNFSFNLVNKIDEQKITEISKSLPDNLKEEKFNFYKSMADEQFQKGLFTEAYSNYEQSLKYNDNKEVREKMILAKEGISSNNSRSDHD